MSIIFLLIGIVSIGLKFTVVQSVGVCYGVNGDNLPSRQEVVDLYKSKGINKMRIFYPDEDALRALRGSNIELIIDVARETIPSLANNANDAINWVNKYVKPYAQDVKIKYIIVGNEIRPYYNDAQFILPALKNIQNAISSANLQGQIKVSIAIDMTLIDKSYPPNNGVFSDGAKSYIQPIIDFLASNGAPFLANVYPYFAYNDNSGSIPIDYALFKQQGNNAVGYQNLFDAQLDSIYAALEKAGHPNVKIIVSESGWPSAGRDKANAATIDNAATYYANLINHINSGKGTPKRPGAIEAYLFAMFDENRKNGGDTEQHFGVFNPNKSPKYQINFN